MEDPPIRILLRRSPGSRIAPAGPTNCTSFTKKTKRVWHAFWPWNAISRHPTKRKLTFWGNLFVTMEVVAAPNKIIPVGFCTEFWPGGFKNTPGGHPGLQKSNTPNMSRTLVSKSWVPHPRSGFVWQMSGMAPGYLLAY